MGRDTPRGRGGWEPQSLPIPEQGPLSLARGSNSLLASLSSGLNAACGRSGSTDPQALSQANWVVGWTWGGRVRAPIGPEQGEHVLPPTPSPAALLGYSWTLVPCLSLSGICLDARDRCPYWASSTLWPRPCSLSPLASSLTLMISTAWPGGHPRLPPDCSVPDLPGRQTVGGVAPDKGSWGHFGPELSGLQQTQ